MVHLDAHADLGVSALSWQQQADAPLAELLRCMDEAGDASIAEWIVPLALRNTINAIHWVLPAFMAAPAAAAPSPGRVHDWLPSQRVAFCRTRSTDTATDKAPAARATKAARTTDTPLEELESVLPHTLLSYYVSDGPVVEEHAPAQAAPPSTAASAPACTVHVHHLSSLLCRGALLRDDTPWALDVCLDYFHCRNEHRDILHRFFSRREMADATQAWAVQDAVLGMPLPDAQRLVRAHARVLHSMLAVAEEAAAGAAAKDALADGQTGALQELLLQHMPHSSPFVCMAAELLQGVLAANGWRVPVAAVGTELASGLEHAPAEGLPAALFECGPCLSLPHHPAGVDEMQQALDALRTVLRGASRPPAVITVACSADDGFVPHKVATWLLPRVISTIQEGLVRVCSSPPQVVCCAQLSPQLAAAAVEPPRSPSAAAGSATP